MQTIKQEHEYVVSISFDSLRAFIRAMIEAHEFDHEYQFDIKLPDKRSSFYQAFRIPGNRETKHYTNWIYMTPQDDSVLIKTLLEIHREIEGPPALPITWNKLRSKLERTGRKLTLVDGFENTNVFAHRYIDPSKITNPNHRKVIEALIEAESDKTRRVKQKDIAESLEYSPGRISEIKKIYLRPEYQKTKNKEDNPE